MGPAPYPETSVNTNPVSLRNVPEDRRHQISRCQGLKALIQDGNFAGRLHMGPHCTQNPDVSLALAFIYCNLDAKLSKMLASMGDIDSRMLWSSGQHCWFIFRR
jgi:hypothetical protein